MLRRAAQRQLARRHGPGLRALLCSHSLLETFLALTPPALGPDFAKKRSYSKPRGLLRVGTI